MKYSLMKTVSSQRHLHLNREGDFKSKAFPKQWPRGGIGYDPVFLTHGSVLGVSLQFGGSTAQHRSPLAIPHRTASGISTANICTPDPPGLMTSSGSVYDFDSLFLPPL